MLCGPSFAGGNMAGVTENPGEMPEWLKGLPC